MANPVFYDPLQARWRRLRRLFDAAGIALIVLVIFFVYTALHNEPLPELLLQFQKRPYHALREAEKEKA
ncbi:MAG: polysaccharide deacetylase, partial [Acidobacteriaceae bacterium]|nr:polysaccharide deacetylase [Acidobacteriaceae bacterium]